MAFSFSTPAASTSAAPKFSFAPIPTASTSTSTPSLFGSTPAPAQASTSLFGQSTAPKPTGSLFGGFGQTQQPQQQAQPQPSTSLFGAPQQQQPAANPFGQSQPQAQAPAAPSNISKTSKFNDLPENVRSVVEGIEKMIQAQIQVSEELKTRDLTGINKTTTLYEDCLAESTLVRNQLSDDARLAADLRARLEQDLADLNKVTSIIEGFKSPQTKGAQAKTVANFPFEYFSRKTNEFRERLSVYKATIEQIQHVLDSSTSLDRNPSAIVPTLRAQHTSFMSLASRVAELDTELKGLKEEYKTIWREKTGSVQDPFKGNDKGRRGIENALEGMELR